MSFYGLALFEPKTPENVGMVLRSAYCFGVDIVYLIGKRFSKNPTNTTKSERHIPIIECDDLEDFKKHIPIGCQIIGVEVDGRDITNFVHPKSCIYILGGEDRNVPQEFNTRIRINTQICLNMAVAASLICFDRKTKSMPPTEKMYALYRNN